VWWRRYRELRLRRKAWSDEAMELLEAASIMPEDVAGHLPKLLLAFAAEDCLQGTKEKILMFKEKNGPDTKVARSEVRKVVRILRDCRTLVLGSTKAGLISYSSCLIGQRSNTLCRLSLLLVSF